MFQYDSLDIGLGSTGKHHVINVFALQFVGPYAHTVPTMEHGVHVLDDLSVSRLVVINHNARFFVYANRQMFEGSGTAHGDGIFEEESVERTLNDDRGFLGRVSLKTKPTSIR